MLLSTNLYIFPITVSASFRLSANCLALAFGLITIATILNGLSW